MARRTRRTSSRLTTGEQERLLNRPGLHLAQGPGPTRSGFTRVSRSVPRTLRFAARRSRQPAGEHHCRDRFTGRSRRAVSAGGCTLGRATCAHTPAITIIKRNWHTPSTSTPSCNCSWRAGVTKFRRPLGVCNRARRPASRAAGSGSFRTAPLRRTLGSVCLDRQYPFGADQNTSRRARHSSTGLAILERLASEKPAALDPQIGIAQCHVLLARISSSPMESHRRWIISAIHRPAQGHRARRARTADQASSLAVDLGDPVLARATCTGYSIRRSLSRQRAEVFRRLRPPVARHAELPRRAGPRLQRDQRRASCRLEPGESLAYAEKARPCSSGWSPTSGGHRLAPRSGQVQQYRPPAPAVGRAGRGRAVVPASRRPARGPARARRDRPL